MGKKYEGICVPRKSSQRVTSVEEDFNTQVDRMTYYMNTSQSFFPATHVIAQQAHEQSSHCSQDRGYAWTQLHGPSLTKAKLAKAITECPNWQQQRRTLGPLHGTIPGWTVDYIWPLPSWKGQCFILNRIFTLDIHLPSLHANLLPKLPFCGFTERLIHHHGIPHNIVFNHGSYLSANEVCQWAHACGIHWFYHVVCYPEATGLIKWWKGFLKTWFQY